MFLHTRPLGLITMELNKETNTLTFSSLSITSTPPPPSAAPSQEPQPSGGEVAGPHPTAPDGHHLLGWGPPGPKAPTVTALWPRVRGTRPATSADRSRVVQSSPGAGDTRWGPSLGASQRCTVTTYQPGASPLRAAIIINAILCKNKFQS